MAERKQIEAWKFFFPMGNGKAMVTINPVTGEEEDWVLHHEDTELKKNDPKRYHEWRIEDLIMMKRKDHTSLHLKNKVTGRPSPMCGKKHSEETKKRMSDAQKGKTFSEETCKRISESKKGHKYSEEAKKHMSEAHKGKSSPLKGRPSPLKGRTRSEEIKRKLSEICKGRKNSEEAKKKMSEAKKGCHWWCKEGEKPVYAKEKPGDDWEIGRK